MKTKLQLLVVAAAAALFSLFTNNASAQFDPAQFRQQQLDRHRERLDVKSDDEWKKIEPLVTKIMDAQRDARMGLSFGFGGRRGGGGGGGFSGDPTPEGDALQKAMDSKASPDDLKAKLAKFRDARKAKETALEKAQDDLRKALTPRQEVAAVLGGLLR